MSLAAPSSVLELIPNCHAGSTKAHLNLFAFLLGVKLRGGFKVLQSERSSEYARLRVEDPVSTIGLFSTSCDSFKQTVVTLVQ